MGNIIAEVRSWVETPLTTPVDATNLFLIVGVIMIAVIGWSFILYHIRSAAETVV